MATIAEAVAELHARGVQVLSPADPTVVDAIGEFLFVASDKVRSVRLVEDRHLESIRVSDFLWLVCPDGYVGQSAALELGYAAALGKPVYASCRPHDLTLAQYVHVLPGIDAAVLLASQAYVGECHAGLLIDPERSLDTAMEGVQEIQDALSKAPSKITDQVGYRVLAASHRIRTAVSVPTSQSGSRKLQDV